MRNAIRILVTVSVFAAAGAIAVAPRPALAQQPTVDDAPLAPAPADSQLRLALALSGERSTNFFSDGHYNDTPPFDAGLEAEYLRVLGRHVYWGLGVRYTVGAGTLPYAAGSTETEQLAFLPALLGCFWRFAVTGDEIGLTAGLGPTMGAFSFGAQQGRLMWTTGIGAELGATFAHTLTPNLAITAGISLRLLALDVRSGANSSDFNTGFHGEIPFHLGVRYRL
jgi:hypothetical protein